jgi:hypothetical protein
MEGTEMYRELTAAGLIVVALVACKPSDGGKATKASYAGDGATMFVDSTGRACSGDYSICARKGNGKLKFGVGYKAHYVDTTDRTNCHWSLYTINAAGKATVIKSGGYFKANIKVERTSRVQVWLKSDECGDWKPTK